MDVSRGTPRDVSNDGKRLFTVPFIPDPDFVDRPSIMMWLRAQHSGPIRRFGLFGMCGVGKTHLGLQFAYQLLAASPTTSVFWINGATRATFEESCRLLADKVDLPRRHDHGVNICRLVCDWLQMAEIGPWFMILDNADDADLSSATNEGEPSARMPLASYLPITGTGKLLVISRDSNAAETFVGSHQAILRVPAMTASQALRLFRTKMDRDFDEDAVADLLCALDFIPLAVAQAAAYINQRYPHESVRSYLDNFLQGRNRQSRYFNRDTGLRSNKSMFQPVVLTWRISFEKIHRQRRSAANLLSLMSFFHPHNIPEYMLHGYSEAAMSRGGIFDDDDVDFMADLDVLRCYSFINTTREKGVCELHPQVQVCTRNWLSRFDDQRRWKQLFLSLSARHFPPGTSETRAECGMLLPHVRPLLQEQLSERSEFLEWCHLLTNVSSYLAMIGDYHGAECLLQQTIDGKERLMGEDHFSTLNSMATLASAYWKHGRLNEAEKLSMRVMETTKSALGEEHPEALTSMANLSLIYQSQGRMREAERLETKVLEAKERILGEDHPSTLTSMANLASTYWSQGLWKDAEELEVRVMTTRNLLLGEDHPSTLTATANLASTYWNQQRWMEAEVLFARVMEMTKKVLGEDHPDTLTSMNNLAWTWHQSGRHADAVVLMQECAHLRLRILGQDHSHTRSSESALEAWEGFISKS